MGDLEIAWAIAAILTGAFIGYATLGTGRLRIACVALSFVPIVAPILMWAPMAHNTASRIGYSALVGALCGAFLLAGVVEFIYAKASTPMAPNEKADAPPSPPSVTQNNQGGPNQNFQGPGPYNFHFAPPTPMPPAKPPRDPDTIYQLGKPVGNVHAREENLSEGTIFFDTIYQAMDLDIGSEVIYRNYRLRLISGPSAEAGSRTAPPPQGRWIERRVMMLTFKIVGTAD